MARSCTNGPGRPAAVAPDLERVPALVAKPARENGMEYRFGMTVRRRHLCAMSTLLSTSAATRSTRGTYSVLTRCDLILHRMAACMPI